MPPQIALLRGINLGSRNRVPMPELREKLSAAGYGEVETVVRSGNLVLEKPANADELRELIKQWFDVDQPVIVRTAAQWRKVIDKNPLDVPDGKRFQVVFFAGRVKQIDVGDIGDDEVALRRSRDLLLASERHPEVASGEGPRQARRRHRAQLEHHPQTRGAAVSRRTDFARVVEPFVSPKGAHIHAKATRTPRRSAVGRSGPSPCFTSRTRARPPLPAASGHAVADA